MAKGKAKSRFVENHEFFVYLAKLPTNRQKAIIKGADRPILLALSEICLNIMRRNVPLTEKEKRLLRPYEKQVYQLSLKKQSTSKKKQIVQRGGFLGTLLTSVLPILISTIIGATTSGKK